MFLSKSDEETTNKKLAKDLVDKWVIDFLLSLHLGIHLSISLHIPLCSLKSLQYLYARVHGRKVTKWPVNVFSSLMLT